MTELEYQIQILEETIIQPSNSCYNALFGMSISLSSNRKTLVVGAPEDKGITYETGAVYVYKLDGTTWKETKITASDGEAGEKFGYTVSAAADRNSFIAGAPDDDDNGFHSGSVYVYKWNDSGWDETKILAQDGNGYDYFGSSVSMSADGNCFIVGTPEDDDNGTDSGAVYVYKWNGSGWDETKILARDGYKYDSFGSSVSISADGNCFIVGAPEDDDNGWYAGSVYVYKWNGSDWDETKILARDGDEDDYFGYRVSMSTEGNNFIAGTPDNGAVYVYKWNGSGWDETKIFARDNAYDFGCSVSMAADGNSFIVGAWDSVYIYKRNNKNWEEIEVSGKYDSNYGKSVIIADDIACFVVGAPDYSNSGAVYVYK
ncbi:MAG: hypothetical protein JXB88_07435 [Spirochaetales bacterium]|nr:hypothetical protein [Spirochaetales bacterium]